MMQIHWQDGVRAHVGCGGAVEIIPDGYICTACGEQSFSDTLSDEEQERQEQEDEEARDRSATSTSATSGRSSTTDRTDPSGD